MTEELGAYRSRTKKQIEDWRAAKAEEQKTLVNKKAALEEVDKANAQEAWQAKQDANRDLVHSYKLDKVWIADPQILTSFNF